MPIQASPSSFVPPLGATAHCPLPTAHRPLPTAAIFHHFGRESFSNDDVLRNYKIGELKDSRASAHRRSGMHPAGCPAIDPPAAVGGRYDARCHPPEVRDMPNDNPPAPSGESSALW